MDKKVLLIADDEEMNRRIIRKFLKDYFEVIEAANGKQVMERVHAEHIDVVLLDIIMPEMDGLEVLKLMKTEPELEHIGVLVATSTKERTERTALFLGADDVVSKPYDPVVIRKRLNNILMVKAINTQKEIMSEKAQTISGEIQAYADQISTNHNDGELITRLTEKIKDEAKKLIEIFSNQE